jgi:hypothetical protein
MKKIFTLVCAVALGLGTMHAKLILHESFDGENGTVGTLNQGLNTEMGTNTANWWSYSGDKNFIEVVEGSLSFAGYQTQGQGNKVKLISGSAADDFRQFEEIKSGKVYLAAVIHIETPKNSETADYFLCLGDATPSSMYARLYAKTVKENGEVKGVRFGVSKFNESASYINLSEEMFEAGKDILVVTEYEYVDGDNNDVARLYINPTRQTSEPTVEVTQSGVTSGSGAEQGSSSKKDASVIASVNLRQGSTTPASVFVDEIKVATAWADLFEAATGIENTESQPSQSRKIMRDGVLIIEHGGKQFNILGTEIK